MKVKESVKAFPFQVGQGAFPLLGGPRAFTLVELIVVVTILALLSTIGFVSYSSYLSGVRDTNRLSQLVAISDGLELYRTKKTLPIPDDNIEIRANGTVIGYQGYAGINVLETIDYSKTGKDPKDKIHFSYYLTQDKKYYQLLTYLEEEENLETNNNLFQKTYADIDYTNRYPKVSGKKLGILTQSGTNIPVQEVNTVVSSGYLDIGTTTEEYIALITDEIKIIGDNSELSSLEGLQNIGGIALSTCKALLEKKENLLNKDGVYLLNGGEDNLRLVYCDMTTDGGGWTLFASNGGESGGGKPAPGSQDYGDLSISTIGDMNIKNKNFEGIMAYRFTEEYYIFFDKIDTVLFKQELFDIAGETSSSIDAQTDLGESIHKGKVNGYTFSKSIDTTVFEIHRGGWDPASGVNWIMDAGTKSYGTSASNPLSFSSKGARFNDKDNNPLSPSGNYGLFFR